MSYVSTNLNRFYAALESSYGTAPAIGADDAFRALGMDLELVQQYLERRDKSGTRTFGGVAQGGRRHARFQVRAYAMPGGSAGAAPDLAPLYQAACGGAPLAFGGGTAAAGCTTTSIVFASAHGLAVGQAIGSNGEIRFVTSVPNSTTVVVDPPFTAAPASSSAITGTVAYPLAADLPSVSLFDYWEPGSAQQRIVNGAAVDTMSLELAGDFHTVTFSGEAQDLIDSITFASGQGGLGAFPAEPSSRNYNGQPIAGHFGQLWLGASPSRFNTLVQGKLNLSNGLELRNSELGSAVPLAVVPGERRVTFEFELFEIDDNATQQLYAAARNRTAVVAFLQLGSTPGRLMGAYRKSLTPQAPRNDGGERQLKWSFAESRAAGTDNDEMWLAFG